MTPRIQVLFTPADFAALSQRELAGAACVVFDVLRATTTMVTALANGAAAIVPVEDIAAALELRRQQADVLLGGERGGRRIGADLTGGVKFDLGNSPREYAPERVRGRTIVMTTTNGTRALRACLGAQRIWLGALANLAAVAARVRDSAPRPLWLVCSGTGEAAAWEDTLAAGALCEALGPVADAAAGAADSAFLARELYRRFAADLPGSMRFSRNARRLLAMPDLRDDVEFCLRRDTTDCTPVCLPDGRIVRQAVA